MSFTDVQEVLRSLLYIKGEIVVTQLQKTLIDLVIKKTTFMKVFVRIRLIDRGSELNELEIITSNRYGQSKSNFNFDDIND